MTRRRINSVPRLPRALEALESADRAIGRIRDAISSDPTARLVVISDHGFVPVEMETAPLAMFAEHGLFAQGADGWIRAAPFGKRRRMPAGRWRFTGSKSPRRMNGGCLDSALEALKESGGVNTILDRSQLEHRTPTPTPR